jgi:tripartite-type tricarboxylate transporter receptor subunit TctC
MQLDQLKRRDVITLLGGATALVAVSRLAWAQAYPSRPVRLIVPFGPAGATDITARLMGQSLSERLGQPFVIENRPGAGGTIATEAVVRAAPDGYTLLYVTTANASNATLYDKLNFNFVRDIAPIAPIVGFPYIMVVNPTVSAKTLPEFIAYAKINPGKINMASPGIGSTPHVNGELFKMMTGTNLVHVPYRSAAAVMTDLLSGQVQLYFGTTASSLEYVRTGKLRALAVTIERRLDALPDVPTVGEFVPGYEASNWYGLGAPKNTPAAIIGILNREVNAALADPAIKARIADLGGVVLAGSPADFGKLIADETEKWGKVIRAANIKAE